MSTLREAPQLATYLKRAAGDMNRGRILLPPEILRAIIDTLEAAPDLLELIEAADAILHEIADPENPDFAEDFTASEQALANALDSLRSKGVIEDA